MFITPEKIGHSKGGDIASLMITAVKAVQLVYIHTHTHTNRLVVLSVIFNWSNQVILRSRGRDEKVNLKMFYNYSVCNVNTAN